MTKKDKMVLVILAFSLIGFAAASCSLLLLGYQLAEWFTK